MKRKGIMMMPVVYHGVPATIEWRPEKCLQCDSPVEVTEERVTKYTNLLVWTCGCNVQWTMMHPHMWPDQWVPNPTSGVSNETDAPAQVDDR